MPVALGAKRFILSQGNIVKKTLISLVAVCWLSAPAAADVYFFNTTNDQMTYEVSLPNGDTKKGDIKHNRGYGPAQSHFSNSKGDQTPFKIFNEEGKQIYKGKGAYSRTFLIGQIGGKFKVTPASWYTDNGQKHKRVMALYNGTDKPLTFDIIDEKEVRKGITLKPGERKTVSAKNGFSGSSGFHTFRLADGARLEKAGSVGYLVIFYNDKRYDTVQASTYGHVTIPRGVKE